MIHRPAAVAAGLCLLLTACGPSEQAKAPVRAADAPPEAAFPDEQDSALVKAATAAVPLHPAARGAFRFRDITISSSPDGAWRAVCGEASTDGDRWRGFIHLVQRGEAQQALEVQKDALSNAQSAACRPLVLKYFGEARVDFDAADKAFADVGCTGLDVAYWDAWKRYCHAQVVRPAAAGAP